MIPEDSIRSSATISYSKIPSGPVILEDEKLSDTAIQEDEIRIRIRIRIYLSW